MIPLLDGHCSAAAVASNAAACIQHCCLSSQVLSPAHFQPGISECRGDSGGGFGYVYTFLPITFIVAACWCVGFLCPHSNVPLFSSFLSLNFQPGSSELGEGVILMGALEIGTCGSCTPLLLLVSVLVFCVPIPTSHCSVPFSRSTFAWQL